MILSDRSIKEAIASGRLGIEPYDPKLVQPSSIDVRLDNKFLVFRNTKRAYIDVKQPADDLMEMIEVGTDDPMFLHPHEFVLGSTIERVRMPDDLVARLEGRSSLGRLGVVIHSSLPYDAAVLFEEEGGVLEPRLIGEIVENRLRGRVVSFDRDTFEVCFHSVTNWLRELPDRIYEVRLCSGRKVQVTAGHNLFTLDSAGELVKTPTGALNPGTRVAIPKCIPDPTDAEPRYRLVDLLPSSVRQKLLCSGPATDQAFERFPSQVRRLLHDDRLPVSYYVRSRLLPLSVLERLTDAVPAFGPDDRFGICSSQAFVPAVLTIDREFAWLLGLYLAYGYRRDKQVIIEDTDQRVLDRAEAAFRALGQSVYRTAGAIMCCSPLISEVFRSLEMGSNAARKHFPRGALGWPRQLLDALVKGLLDGGGLDGDGSIRPDRNCLRTTSDQLVSDVLLGSVRVGKRAVTQVQSPRPGCRPSYVVSIHNNRHRVLTSITEPGARLKDVRVELGVTHRAAAALCAFEHATSSNEIGRDTTPATLHVGTLEPIHDSYARLVPPVFSPIRNLTRLVNADLDWDEVTEVVDTGRFEVVYDLEVRSSTARIENFLAGFGGVFVSNTAGFIDPSFEGHVTLEISNLANLPIALYPSMRIGQLSFSLMTTPAERPYGPERGSKYSGQNVPTASRLYLDFQP